MMEAKLRPLITKERDTLAMPFSPIAPKTAHISVGAHQRTFLLPPTLNSIQPTTACVSSVPTYRQTSTMEAISQELSAMAIKKVITAPTSLKTTAETPATPIPPKPPDFQTITPYAFKPSNLANGEWDSSRRAPDRRGTDNNNPQNGHVPKCLLQNNSTTMKRDDVMAAVSRLREDSSTSSENIANALRPLRSNNYESNKTCKPMPSTSVHNDERYRVALGQACGPLQSHVSTTPASTKATPSTTLRGAATQCNEPFAPLPLTPIYGRATSWSVRVERKDYLYKNTLRRMQMPDSPYYGPSSPVFVATTTTILTKWQSMRHFHRHTNSGLFPHGHQPDTAILPEESVLLWTLLQPTLDSPRRQTYAWNEQLDQLVQAIDDCDPQSTFQQFTRFFQGACISKAMWSSSGDFGPLPKLPFANSESSDWRPPSIRTQPLLSNLPDIRNMKTHSSPQMRSCHLDARVPLIQPLPGKSHPHDISTDRPLGTFTAILFLLDLDTGTSHFQAKYSIPQSASSENQHYQHPPRKTPVQAPNRCKRWIAAIIQRRRETAWDLDTHRNIEAEAIGPG